jgi:hypothetical protein
MYADVNPATLRNWVEAAERPVEPSGLALANEVARENGGGSGECRAASGE